ncbi:hypothetical protein B4U80_07494, partial [Leptotrombidium deliense]
LTTLWSPNKKISKKEVKNKEKTDPDVCNSKECHKTAKYLFANMNLTVDPCEDFYNYSCGGWKHVHPRPKGVHFWGVNTLVEVHLKQKIRSKIFLKIKNQIFQWLLRKHKVFMLLVQTLVSEFQLSKNSLKKLFLEFREEYGRDAIVKMLRKMGGYPLMSSDWDDDNFNWQKAYMYADVHINAVNIFFDYIIDRKLENNKTRFIELQQQSKFYVGSKLNGDITKEEKLKLETSFRKKVKSQLAQLKSDLDETKINSDIDEMIKFEKQLAKVAGNDDDNGSDDEEENDYQVWNITYMHTMYPYVNWIKIFSNAFKIVNVTISKEEVIFSSNPTYFSVLGLILKKTPKRVIANYMAFVVVEEFGEKAINNYELIENGTINVEKLKEACTQSTEVFFRVAINYWYMKTILGKNSMKELNDFLSHIKAALTLTINTNEWMNDKTKLEAQLKLNKMLDFIASPSNINNDSELNEFYRNTGFISSENYVHAFKKMSKWIKYDKLKSLRDTEEKKVQPPSEVNAYYSPYDNKIGELRVPKLKLILIILEILIGYLSPPNFYPNAPISVNTAAIGSTIGHEVTHGFDNTGAQYNYKGIKRNWWDSKTLKRYESKVNCFKKQYSAFVEPTSGKHLNGTKTVGENIADNGGLRQTYTAYKMYAALKHPEKDLKLPLGMSKFSKEQLFFIAYANTYCNDHSALYNEHLILNDEHPPDVARVIIPLQNSEQFSKAFKCKEGSRMNPAKKCILW